MSTPHISGVILRFAIKKTISNICFYHACMAFISDDWTRAHYSAPVYVVSNQSVFWLQNARLTKWVVSGLRPFSSSETKGDSTPSSVIIIIIMYIYHALINALSAHMIYINLNMIFYTHVKHSPTKTIYIKYYLKIKNKNNINKIILLLLCTAYVITLFLLWLPFMPYSRGDSVSVLILKKAFHVNCLELNTAKSKEMALGGRG